MATILIVDDERGLRRVLSALLSELGHTIVEAEHGEQALQMSDLQAFDVALVDLSLPGMTGLQLLERLRDRDPAAAYVVMTAFGSIRSAVEAMRKGAFDYLAKPLDHDELLLIIDRALEQRRLTAEVHALREELASRYGFTDLIGASSAMREVFTIMRRVAATDVTVLILGESGTGKELVARGIHQASPRSAGPFVAVNCSAIPPTLVESEFFGHERGAFTDAKENHRGKFEQAQGGTIFLDEIGDLALDAQAKLLRVIEDRQVMRLGSDRAIALKVRVVAATHQPLEAAIKKGTFREDLYWRLNVVSLKLPALRERVADLPMLIDHLLDRINREFGTQVTAIANEARRLLLAYEWPGNVRELENALRRAVVLAQDRTLRAADLPARIQSLGLDAADGAVWTGEAVSLSDATSRAVERIERALIRTTVSGCRGNRTAAAQALGINRKTLFTKMRQSGLLAVEDASDDPAI